jgi:sec-independent protein translocase protein TatC
MTLTEHLEELRWCLLKSLAAIVLASGLCYFFSDAIFRFTVAPLRQSLRPGQSLIGTGVTEAFFIEIKVAIAGEFFSPVRLFSTRSGVLLLRVFRGREEAGPAVCLVCDAFFLGAFFATESFFPLLSVFHRAIRDDRGNAGNTHRGIFYFFSVWF